MTEEIVELASRYGRYDHRRVTALLRMEGWDVNHKRVERIWRREGLKVPAKQPKSRSRNQTWKRVAEEAQVSASTLIRMAQGRRPDVDSLAALVAWSGLRADTFVRDEQGKPEPGSLAMISTYLKSDPHLTPEAADALDELMKATYERMRKKD